MSLLAVSNLRKSYGQRRVVDDVSFQVNSGEIVGLLGPNGAGKTTSFYMTIGLIRSDQGQIFLDERELSRLTMDRRARLGLAYLPQEPSVFRRLSVMDNVLAILELTSKLNRRQRLARAEELLNDLGLLAKASILGQALSGGERRRCEIARALATNPSFILLDEPFAGVDPIAVADIRHIMDHLRQRHIGVLITDHNVRETLKSCQRSYILNNGTVIAAGTPAEIVANEQARRFYLGQDFTL